MPALRIFRRFDEATKGRSASADVGAGFGGMRSSAPGQGAGAPNANRLGLEKGTDDARPLILTRLQNALDDDVNILDRRIEGCRD